MRALDVLGGTLSVAEQATRGPKGITVFGPPKSSAGRRTLAIPRLLIEMLGAHLTRRGLTAEHGDELVFAMPDGGVLDYPNFRYRIWLPATSRAGIPRLTFHDLGRANASGLVLAGVDLKTAQTRLGHSDPRLTLGVYAQATTEADRAASDALGDRFSPSRGMHAGSHRPRRESARARTPADLHLRWSGCRDLNPGPQRPERCALTKLRYIP